MKQRNLAVKNMSKRLATLLLAVAMLMTGCKVNNKGTNTTEKDTTKITTKVKETEEVTSKVEQTIAQTKEEPTPTEVVVETKEVTTETKEITEITQETKETVITETTTKENITSEVIETKEVTEITTVTTPVVEVTTKEVTTQSITTPVVTTEAVTTEIDRLSIPKVPEEYLDTLNDEWRNKFKTFEMQMEYIRPHIFIINTRQMRTDSCWVACDNMLWEIMDLKDIVNSQELNNLYQQMFDLISELENIMNTTTSCINMSHYSRINFYINKVINEGYTVTQLENDRQVRNCLGALNYGYEHVDKCLELTTDENLAIYYNEMCELYNQAIELYESLTNTKVLVKE